MSDELQSIRKIFQENGYPPTVIDNQIRRKIVQFNSEKICGPQKKPVYLRIEYKGIQAEKMVKCVREAVKDTFFSVSFRAVFTTQNTLPVNKKDTLPIRAKSNIIYKFTCKGCESSYIGRCYRRLEERINEHVPALIRKKKTKFTTTEDGIDKMIKHFRTRSKPTEIVQPAGNLLPRVSKSAIGSHLLENPACADLYDSTCFQVLATGRTKYHIDVLEGVLINKEPEPL